MSVRKRKSEKDEHDGFVITEEDGRRYVRIRLISFVLLIATAVIAVILFWSAKRDRVIALRVENPGELKTLLPSIVGLTQSALDQGNHVEVLQNGDGFFPRILADIKAARETIHVESFIWWEGEICNQVAAALAAKAKEGVEVRVLVDASGGRKLRGKLGDMLEASGARVAWFHPVRISNLGRLNNRDHRKLLIVDGRIGYTGGYGFATEWTGNAQDRDHWRDTGLRIIGPVVNRMQAAFCENWIEETGEILAGDKYFPHLPHAGNTPAHAAYTSPTGSVSSVQVLYYMAIKAARKEIIIQNPYLLPDPSSIGALEDAVARGVSVKIMVPSTEVTDSAFVQHASHHHFGTLLKRGVQMWEYNKTLLHQKVIIVDDIWSCVGSTNFDDRSFELNDEISVGVLDPQIAAQLKSAFAADLRHARKLSFQQWKERSLWHKMIDGLAYVGKDQL